MVGYHSLEKLSWIDAFLNAAMILSGMETRGDFCKPMPENLFAGCYALFSGLAAHFDHRHYYGRRSCLRFFAQVSPGLARKTKARRANAGGV